MESVPESSQVLRTRAASLRRHAVRLESRPLSPVRLRAGDQTWIGPTAQRFAEELAHAESVVRAAAEALRSRARRLDSLADAAAGSAVMQGPV